MTAFAQRITIVFLFLFSTQVFSAAFTAGNIVVYRVGDGAAALTSAATAVFLDEYTTSGTLVQSIALPTALSGAQRRLTASGTATSEGLLSRSANGACVLLTGYDAPTGTASISGTTAAAANRVIGLVSASGATDTSTGLTNFSANNVRSAASTDCTNLWATGANDGVRYVSLGSSTTTQISSTVTNLRQLNIFDGQLYVSTGSGTAVRLGAVGVGAPTSTGQTITNLPGLPITGSPFSYYFADLSSAVAGIDTLYIADDTTTIGLQKYSLVGGTWVSNGGISGAGIRGLTAVPSGADVTLYATTTANAIVAVTDASGYNGALTGALSTIVSASVVGANKVIRGIALTPASAAMPADLTVSVNGPASAAVAATYSYGVTVANSGGTNLTGVTTTFTLPVGVSYVSATVVNGFVASESSGVVTLSNGTVNAGSSASLSVVVTAASAGTVNVAAGAVVVDPANAIIESNESNNTSTATVSTVVSNIANTVPTISTIDALSGVISDSTNPTTSFTVTDAESLPGTLTVIALSSSNTAVVPLANVSFTNTNGTVVAAIIPAATGYSDVTIQVSDGTLTATQVLRYAASAASATPATSRYHYGSSDASTAVAIDTNFMLVADDENQQLRLYDRQSSGYPLTSFDFTSSLGLSDLSGGLPREVDIEAATKVGSRIYWLGSHSNSASGNVRINRNRLFATDIAGAGSSTTLSYVGRYDGLRTDLIAWDQGNAHGLGVDYFGFAAGAAAGVVPEVATLGGFNIEGLVMAPDNTTGYLAFRAPQTPATNRTQALIVPVINFTSLVGGNPTAITATFGAPIQLDLGGRGIREIQKNSSNQYLIIAGPADNATGTAPKNFVLYTWDGNAASQPLLRGANLTALNSGGSFESIVDVPSPLTASSSIQVLSDNGDTIYYNDGTIAKDLAESRFKKARSDLIALGSVAGVLPINVVQGSGNASPLVGQAVTVSGIVVANFEGPNRLGGFYIEAPDAEWDSDPVTSEGIFIYTNNASATPTVTVGDRVNVNGNVIEFGTAPNTLTEITNPVVTLISSGNALPSSVTVTLPVTAVADLERYEGMRVNFTQTLTVSDNDSLGQYGELTLSSSGRILQPTNYIDPNDAAASGTSSSGSGNVAAINAQLSLNQRSTIVLDDASTKQYPFPIPFWDNANNTLRIGTTISNLTGIIGNAFGSYRVFSTTAPNFNFAARPAAPDVGGNVKVGSMNVLNYFNGNGDGTGFPTSRGADTAEEFSRQRGKAIAAILGLNADVLALMEMENDGTGPTSAIQNLVAGLNATAGAGTWAFIQDPANYASVPGGTDLIRATMIYKAAVVAPVGMPQTISDTAFVQARAPIAQTFRLTSNNEQFTVVANHFKSKGTSAGLPGDSDQGDGQALSNQTRRLQATALLGFISSLAATGPARVITVGDFNAYGEEDPIDILRAGDLSTIINNSYSYLFRGQMGALDHALGNTALMSTVTGSAEWHINADEPVLLDYNLEDKSPLTCTVNCSTPDYVGADTSPKPYRASDHDPLIVGLQLLAAQTITLGANPSPINYSQGTFAVIATGGASGNPVIFTVPTTTSVCSVTGSIVTILSAGSCTVVANQTGNTSFSAATPVNISIEINQATQTIAFTALTNRTLGTAPFTVSATGGASGNVVTFSSTTPTTCTVVSSTVTLVNAGTCTVSASQAGNDNYTAAANIDQSFEITSAPLVQTQTISGFAPVTPVAFGAPSVILNATGGASGLPVIFATTSTATICSVTGNQVNFTGAGSCNLTANQAGDVNFSAAPQVTATIMVSPATQTIVFNTLANRTLGTAPFNLSATGGASGNPVSFSSTTTATCTVTGSIVTLVSAGTCTIRASQSGSVNFAAALNVEQSFAITALCDITDNALDCDADGIPNGVERQQGTNPAVRDNNVFSDTDASRRLFVMQLYRDLLDREADDAGLLFWSGELNAGRVTREGLVQMFLFSQEAERTEGQAARLFFAALQRAPEPAGLKYWTEQIATQGAVVVADAFASSPEFLARYGALDNAGFIDRMYRNVLGRPVDPAGAAFWLEQMNEPNNRTRGQVLTDFANSTEYRQVIDADVAVTRLYIVMLGRAPDNTGLVFWAIRLENGGSIQELISAFLESTEYRARFL